MRAELRSRLIGLAAEETTLFASILKWTILATVAGIVAGCATAVFLGALEGDRGRAPALSRIPLLVAPAKLVATVVTTAVGGSAGKEGPAGALGTPGSPHTIEGSDAW